MKLKTIQLIAAALLVAGFTHAAAPAKPNIVVILSDDMGYSDIGCYGGEIATPTLDGLAKNGLRFTQFYNTARCCPTRASLLTGLYPHQAGIGHMMEDKRLEGYRGNLNRKSVTIAEALKPAGYRSYVVGKWHVTPGKSAKELEDRRNWPLARGFERYYGTIHGAGSFWDPSALVRDGQLITMANDPEYQPEVYYYTDAISDHAVRFVREHSKQNPDQPFFLYVAYTAAHWPMHAKESDIAKYNGRYAAGYEAIHAARWARQKKLGVVDDDWTPAPLVGTPWKDVRERAFEERCMEVYAAMVDSMDQGIGRLVAELRAQGQLENTLVFYLQDNGGCAELVGRGTNTNRATQRFAAMPKEAQQFDSKPKQTRDGRPVREGHGVMPGPDDTYIAYGREWANVSNTPFREYKHWVHEGGIATPLIAHWPKGIARGRRGEIEEQPGHLIDLMATCLDVAGASYPAEFAGEKIRPLEGVSLRPAFAGKKLARTQPIFWEHEGNRAVRDGKWKLVAKGPRGAWELYDMEKDRTETHNLASSEPKRAKAMAAQWDAWAARAHALPWPWKDDEGGAKKLSKRTRFELGSDGELANGEAPDYVGRAFRVSVELSEPGREGVLVAHGGDAHGWALFFQKGALHFAVNRDRKVESVSVPAAKLGGATIIEARLAKDGTAELMANGRTLGQQRFTALPQKLPMDGLQVGRDLGGTVGDYDGPFPFNGKVRAVKIELEPR
jgi:arylsulfatase A-like enzyme